MREAMLTPGANRSTLARPKFENGRRAVGRVGRADADDVGHREHARPEARRVVVVADAVAAAVAGRDDVQRVGVRRDRVLLGRREAGRPEARVDDLDPEVARVVERVGDVRGRAGARRIEHAHRQHLRLRRDAGDADAVVAARGDDPGDVGPVAVEVLWCVVGVDEVPAAPVVDVAVVVVVEAVGLAVMALAVGAGLAGVRGDRALEVGLVELDAGVDDGDRLARAARRLPRVRRVDVVARSRCAADRAIESGRCSAAPTECPSTGRWSSRGPGRFGSA